MELQIGRGVFRTGRARVLHRAMMRGFVLIVFVVVDLFFGRNGVAGRAVHIGNGAARAGIAINKRFVAFVLDQLAHVVHHRRGKDFIDAAIRHRWILIKLRALFNAALYAARNAEGKSDAGFRLRKQMPRIHFIGRALKTAHRGDAAKIGSGGNRRFFNHFAGKHWFLLSVRNQNNTLSVSFSSAASNARRQ